MLGRPGCDGSVPPKKSATFQQSTSKENKIKNKSRVVCFSFFFDATHYDKIGQIYADSFVVVSGITSLC